MYSLLQAVPKAAIATGPPARSPAPASSTVRAPVRPSSSAYEAGNLELGPRGDAFEREADRVAAAVSQFGAGGPQQTLPAPRRCACGGIVGPTGECAGCAAKRRRAQGATPARRPQRIQRLVSGDGGSRTAPVAAGVLRSVDGIRASGGEPLPVSARTDMERAFGTSFAEVRIHRTQAAARVARGLSARAFTVGADVVFGQGSFEPSTERGRRVLAHELAHVEQQRAGIERIQRYDESTEPSTTFGQGAADAFSILGPAEWVVRGIHAAICLSGLETPMEDLTFNHWIPDVCGRRAPGVLHSREWDALGHCWIGCEGTRKCGRSVTAATGTVREFYREAERILGVRPHDSFTQDRANQALGRRLAFTPGRCYTLCDGAHRGGTLDVSAPQSECLDCTASPPSATACP